MFSRLWWCGLTQLHPARPLSVSGTALNLLLAEVVVEMGWVGWSDATVWEHAGMVGGKLFLSVWDFNQWRADGGKAAAEGNWCNKKKQNMQDKGTFNQRIKSTVIWEVSLLVSYKAIEDLNNTYE